MYLLGQVKYLSLFINLRLSVASSSSSWFLSTLLWALELSLDLRFSDSEDGLGFDLSTSSKKLLNIHPPKHMSLVKARLPWGSGVAPSVAPIAQSWIYFNQKYKKF